MSIVRSMTDDEVYKLAQELMQDIDIADIAEKPGGRGMIYAAHDTIRKFVIDRTPVFDWIVKDVWFRDDNVTKRKEPVTVMVVHGVLSIPGLGSRSGIGAHPLDTDAGEDAAYKSAESDAFKRAAMAFGVGLNQLYINADQTKRLLHGQDVESRPARAQQSAPQRTQSPPPPPESRQTQTEPADTGNGSGSGYQGKDPDGPASPSQEKWIRDNLKKMGYDYDADFNMDGLTKAEASAWIEATKLGELPQGVSDPHEMETPDDDPYSHANVSAFLHLDAELKDRRRSWADLLTANKKQPGVWYMEPSAICVRALELQVIQKDELFWRMNAIVQLAEDVDPIIWVDTIMKNAKLQTAEWKKVVADKTTALSG